MREFVTPAAPAGDPVPFAVTMRDEDDKEVRETFVGRPTGRVNYGDLLAALDTDNGAAGMYGALERIVQRDNSKPETGHPTEYARLRAFLSNPDLRIDSATLSAIVEGLVEEYGDRPTSPSSGSAGTPRAVRRGSTATPRKRTSAR